MSDSKPYSGEEKDEAAADVVRFRQSMGGRMLANILQVQQVNADSALRLLIPVADNLPQIAKNQSQWQSAEMVKMALDQIEKKEIADDGR